MKVGITGGTGFIGSHLTRRLVEDGHHVVLVSRGHANETSTLRALDRTEFVTSSISDENSLRTAFADCDHVAHLAGINIERGSQTYDTVHVQGTENVVAAAKDAGVTTMVLSSFLRARPECGSAYHESKWAAEEIVRRSELEYTILKPGITYGRGDHMLSHISRALVTVPVFGLLGRSERRLRPLAIEDLVKCMVAALSESRFTGTTLGIMGPEELTLREIIQRVGDVLDRSPLMVPIPVRAHYGFAWVQERVLDTPLTTATQVTILAEDGTTPAPERVCDPIPEAVRPTQPFSKENIERGLTNPQPYGRSDLRWGT